MNNMTNVIALPHRPQSSSIAVSKSWLQLKLHAVEALREENLAIFQEKLNNITSKPLSAANSLLSKSDKEISILKVKKAGKLLEECNMKLFDMLMIFYEQDEEPDEHDSDTMTRENNVDSVYNSDINNSCEVETSSKDLVVYTAPSKATKEIEADYKQQQQEEETPIWEVEQKITNIPAEEDVESTTTDTLHIDPVYLNVTVSHCETPGSFYIQEIRNHNNVEDFQMKLNNYYCKLNLANTLKVDCNVTIGDLYVTKYEWDMSWYRVKVIEICGENAFKVHFVDYGNKQTVSKSMLRKLTPQFSADNFYAVHCKLIGVYPKNKDGSSDWLEESITWFNDFVQGNNLRISTPDGNVKAMFKDKSDQCHAVELTYESFNKGEDPKSFNRIADTMAQFDLATTEKNDLKIVNKPQKVRTVVKMPQSEKKIVTATVSDVDSSTDSLAARFESHVKATEDGFAIYQRLLQRNSENSNFALHTNNKNTGLRNKA